MHRVTHFVFVSAIIIAAAGALNAQGVLTFETESHDFGTIIEGEKPTFVFRFTNTGDAPLTISHVQPSCGCTAPSYSTDPVVPNDMGEITIEYNSEGRPGEFNKTINVQADDAANTFTTLRILGAVTPVNIQNGIVQGGVVFDADTHTLSDLHAGEAAAHAFKMQNLSERPVRISEARVFNDAVMVAYPDRMIFPGEIVDVEVSVARVEAALNGSGDLDIAIVLSTDDRDQPTKSLRLRGRVHGEGEVAGDVSHDH